MLHKQSKEIQIHDERKKKSSIELDEQSNMRIISNDAHRINNIDTPSYVIIYGLVEVRTHAMGNARMRSTTTQRQIIDITIPSCSAVISSNSGKKTRHDALFVRLTNSNEGSCGSYFRANMCSSISPTSMQIETQDLCTSRHRKG